MIQSLSVKNFQSHSNTHIKFHPGVNVIVGTSDSGKTALLRGMNWVVWNTPGGDAFRSRWGGLTEVSITVDGHTIVRSKDKKDLYKLDDTEYKTFGRKVPEDIAKVLNMDNINLQRQLDGPFLLSETPGAVAQHFNKVANLTKIDTATQEIKKQKQSIKTSIDHDTETLKKKKARLESFDYLTDVEKRIKRLQHKQKLVKRRKQYNKELDTLIDKIKAITSDIEDGKFLLTAEEQVNQTLGKIKKKDKLVIVNKELGKLISKFYTIQRKEKESKELLSKAALVYDVIEKKKALAILKGKNKRLQTLLSNYTKTNNQLILGDDSLLELENKYNKLLHKLGNCPFCGSNLKK